MDKEEGELKATTKRLTPNEIKRKLNDMKLKAWDAHAHSFYSRDVKERPEFHPVSLFFSGLKRGMDFVTITDHDEYGQNEAVKEELKNHPRLAHKFVPGTEFTINDKQLGHVIHVNVYTHTRKDFEKMMTLRNDVVSFVKYCVSRKLPYQYNHPLWFELSDSHNFGEGKFEAIMKYGQLFPVLEVSNSNRPLYENYAGELLAAILRKGITSSSDGHFGDLGAKGYTLARGENFTEFWNNIKNGRAHLVKENLQVEELKQYVLDSIDYLAFPTDLPRVGGRYRIETGNRAVGRMIRVCDRFPVLLKIIRPYVRRRVRRSRSMERYVMNQNAIGKKAIDYFQNHPLFLKEIALMNQVHVLSAI